MSDDLREHLVHRHGRWVSELVGLDDDALHALHRLEHVEEALGLLTRVMVGTPGPTAAPRSSARTRATDGAPARR